MKRQHSLACIAALQEAACRDAAAAPLTAGHLAEGVAVSSPVVLVQPASPQPATLAVRNTGPSPLVVYVVPDPADPNLATAHGARLQFQQHQEGGGGAGLETPGGAVPAGLPTWLEVSPCRFLLPPRKQVVLRLRAQWAEGGRAPGPVRLRLRVAHLFAGNSGAAGLQGPAFTVSTGAHH